MRSNTKKQQDRAAKKKRRQNRIDKNRRPRRKDMDEVKAMGATQFHNVLMGRVINHSKKIQKRFAKDKAKHRKKRAKDGN